MFKNQCKFLKFENNYLAFLHQKQSEWLLIIQVVIISVVCLAVAFIINSIISFHLKLILEVMYTKTHKLI